MPDDGLAKPGISEAKLTKGEDQAYGQRLFGALALAQVGKIHQNQSKSA